MPILNRQEKFILIFLLCTALVGAVIGIFRHNCLKNPEILLSPKNLPNVKIKIAEAVIIAEHNRLVNRKSDNKEESNNKNNSSIQNSIVSSKVVISTNDINNDFDKTESIEKKVTKNTSGLININIASKEDFMTLPYIGEVKAGRIIQLRDEIGVFTSIKDLEKVKGIGTKTLAKIEPFITI